MTHCPFERSARKWIKQAFGVGTPYRRLQEVNLIQGAGDDARLQQAERCFWQLMRDYWYNRFAEVLEWPFEQMQSPSEQLFALALTVAGSARASVTYRVNGKQFGLVGIHKARNSQFVIEPQAEFGEHHVDFLIEYHITMQDYRKTSGIVVKVQKVVVECDGHQFHEKTKKQASRDKARDRAIQKEGVAVLRYSGADIYIDPFKCADEVIRYLEDQMLRSGPQHGVSVEAFQREVKAFIDAYGGMRDTWFYTKQELIERGEEVWDAVQFGIASEGPFFHILNPYYGGVFDEPYSVQENFHDLLRSLGWWYEPITHYLWFFYPVDEDIVE